VYVGGLDSLVTENMLWELFVQAGPVGKVLMYRIFENITMLAVMCS